MCTSVVAIGQKGSTMWFLKQAWVHFCGVLTLNKVGHDTNSSRVTEAKGPPAKFHAPLLFFTVQHDPLLLSKNLPALDTRKKKDEVTSKQHPETLTMHIHRTTCIVEGTAFLLHHTNDVVFLGADNRFEPHFPSIEFALSCPRSSPILSSSPQNETT
jgi:hypothetical protein